MTSALDSAVSFAFALSEATAALHQIRRTATAPTRGYSAEMRLRDIAAAADETLDRLEKRRKELCPTK